MLRLENDNPSAIFYCRRCATKFESCSHSALLRSMTLVRSTNYYIAFRPFYMTATTKSIETDHTPTCLCRYRDALNGPSEDPLVWLFNGAIGGFDAGEVLASAKANNLNVSDCIATLGAVANSNDDFGSQATDTLLKGLAAISAAAQGNTLSHLNEQLLLVELPISLLHKFEGQQDNSHDWTAASEEAIGILSRCVLNVLDDDCWPGAEVRQDFGPLAASWTRSVALLNAVGLSLDEDVLKVLRWLPRQVMRLKRSDRTLMLSSSPATVPDDLLNLMIEVFGDVDDAQIFKRTVDQPESSKPRLVMLDKSRNTISTWGESLLFHDGWEKKSCRISAVFDKTGCQLEIAKAKTLIQGNVFPSLIVDGNPLSIIDQPDVLVEYVDGRVAFAEIEWHMDNEVVMQRQIILSLEDKFAWIGDAINVPVESDIEYCCQWKLGEGISTVEESETNESYLYDGNKMRGLVIPPALNEWKADRSGGQLSFAEDHFSMEVTRKGRSLYVPTFIDLSPKRSLKPRTWRQLTVAENLEIVGQDTAVAYRVHVGKKQFVFYRSMAEPQNRTFFGENVNTEMFLGRLEKDRSMTELVQIE